MLKLTSVFLFVIMCSLVPLHAQSVPDLPKARGARTDLRQAISKETQKIKSESLAIDAKKMEKLRRQVPKKNWTAKKTAIVILIAVGIAALVFLLVKYGKECLRYENDCNPAIDENCYCEEYEQEGDRSRRSR
jgi:hypothetical protein